MTKQKVIVVGAGPVGALAALYAAGRGDDVEVYELRSGRATFPNSSEVLGHRRNLSLLLSYYVEICQEFQRTLSLLLCCQYTCDHLSLCIFPVFCD